MVKVLANGELVPDDDPRVRSTSNQPASSGQSPNAHQVHNIRGVNQNNAEGGPVYQHGPGLSIFDSMNQRLTAAGIPSWNAGPYRVEPIVSVGFLLSLLLMGFRGLIFSGILFFIVKYSQSGGPRIPLPDLSWLGFGGLRGNANNQLGNQLQGVRRGGGNVQSPNQGNTAPSRSSNDDDRHFSGAGHRLGR